MDVEIGKITLFNSTGLLATRKAQIKQHLLAELKPTILLLNKTKLSKDNPKSIGDILSLHSFGYHHKEL
jgi:hypothetical protein